MDINQGEPMKFKNRTKYLVKHNNEWVICEHLSNDVWYFDNDVLSYSSSEFTDIKSLELGVSPLSATVADSELSRHGSNNNISRVKNDNLLQDKLSKTNNARKGNGLNRVVLFVICGTVLYYWNRDYNQSDAQYFQQPTIVEENTNKLDIAPFNIAQICAATVSVLFDKPVNIMKASYISSEIAQIEYTRSYDGTWWRNQCRLTKNTVEWRAMGSTSEPNKEGRWRTEYWVDSVNGNGDSVVFYAIDRKLNKLFITEKHELSKSEINNISNYSPNNFDHTFNFEKLKQIK